MEATAEHRHILRQKWNWPDRIFLGTRDNGDDCFEFRMMDLSPEGVGIVISQEDRRQLETGHQVRVFLPFQVNEYYYDHGPIAWTKTEPDGLHCGVHLNRRAPLYFPVYLRYSTSTDRIFREDVSDPIELFRRLVKDSYYFKRGKLIYLDHLEPYFKRMSTVRGRTSHKEGREFFAQIRERVSGLVRDLEELLELVSAPGFDPFVADYGWDFAKFRNAMRASFNPTDFTNVFKTREVYVYLESIRRLDHRLYINHNTLVLLDATHGVDSIFAQDI